MEGSSLPARGREHATLRRVARERENPKDLPLLGPTRPPQWRSRRVNSDPLHYSALGSRTSALMSRLIVAAIVWSWISIRNIVQRRGCFAARKASRWVGLVSGNDLDVPLRRPLGRIGDAHIPPSQVEKPPHLLVGQRKVEHVEVFDDVLFLERAWHRRNHGLLDEPAQADLCVRLSARFRDLPDDRIVEELATRHR